MLVSHAPFFKNTTSILPTLPFLWENSEPPFLWNFRKLKSHSALCKGEGVRTAVFSQDSSKRTKQKFHIIFRY